MKVVSVNVSEGKGTAKVPVQDIVIDDKGVRGDGHAGNWHRQVSVLGMDSIDRFVAATGRKTGPGEFAENITISGFDLRSVCVLDRFVGADVQLEVTQIGKECHGNTCDIFREVGECVMPKEGLFCRVLRGGAMKAGDELGYEPTALKAKVITLSDRASRGEYEDRSGPVIEDMLNEFSGGRNLRLDIKREVLADDRGVLHECLEAAFSDGCDIIITCGGTGVAPRDITPEVVMDFCEKTIPGIMESIRIKYGAEKPNALLSRSVAGIKGQTLVYALPGSVKAVREYMTEVLKTVEHLIMTVRGVDLH
jgi:molybdopterin adenylyltransferase